MVLATFMDQLNRMLVCNLMVFIKHEDPVAEPPPRLSQFLETSASSTFTLQIRLQTPPHLCASRALLIRFTEDANAMLLAKMLRDE